MAKKKRSAKRYSDDEKKSILAFVEEVNAAKGRGGPAAAKKKYGVSPITLTSWQKKSGGAASKSGSKRAKSAGNPLRRMGDILDEVAKLEASIASLQKEYAKLRKKL